jgi:hypothetical protein
MSENKMGIGQHRIGNVGDGNTGQREHRDPAAIVGQGSGGEEHSQDRVPGSVADSMTHAHGAEESEFYSKNVRRK